jgi:hypothetical protein
MPFQLLNIGTVISLGFYRLVWTTTPRGAAERCARVTGEASAEQRCSRATDFAELNAPPMLNYGTVYPQALLVFVITLMYSVVSPLILPFGAIYFGMGYLVYKYKLLFGLSALRRPGRTLCSGADCRLHFLRQSSTSRTSRAARPGRQPSRAWCSASSSSRSS